MQHHIAPCASPLIKPSAVGLIELIGTLHALSSPLWWEQREEFREAEAAKAGAELGVCAHALQTIKDVIDTTDFFSKPEGIRDAAFLARWAAVVTEVNNVNSFSAFRRDRRGRFLEPFSRRPHAQLYLQRETRALVNAINQLGGGVFGLTIDQLGTGGRYKGKLKKDRTLPTLIPLDQDSLAALALKLKTLAGSPTLEEWEQTDEDAFDAGSLLRRCARSVELIASHAGPGLVDKTVVNSAFDKLNQTLNTIQSWSPNPYDHPDELWVEPGARLSAAFEALIAKVRALGWANNVDVDGINLPQTKAHRTRLANAAPGIETKQQPRSDKRPASSSLDAAESTKRARERSVAKEFEFGRWGAMSERRANMYGLL